MRTIDNAQAKTIIDAEGLGGFAHFGPPDNGTVNKVCVFSHDGKWVTVSTDERAVVLQATIREYETEGLALTDFIDALRVIRSYQNFSR